MLGNQMHGHCPITDCHMDMWGDAFLNKKNSVPNWCPVHGIMGFRRLDGISKRMVTIKRVVVHYVKNLNQLPAIVWLIAFAQVMKPCVDLLTHPLPEGVVDCTMPRRKTDPTCGRILEHCKNKVTNFREKIGIRLCVFKVGVTADPLLRCKYYFENGFTESWIIHTSDSVDLIHMLEAALVSEYHLHVGCRNRKGSGGEGALNRKNCCPPPYFVYVTGCSAAEQPKLKI